MPEVERLLHSPCSRFENWLSNRSEVPAIAAGVYTIWHGARFLYVGMAGRGLTSEALRGRSKPTGLRTRLASHASGRRSGDQFCVYVCDRLVLPTLTPDVITRIASGAVSLDDLTAAYIRQHLGFRWVQTKDGHAAHALEQHFRRGETPAGLPFLNPERPAD